MSTYTIEDYVAAEGTEVKFHIAMHLIRTYERDVHIPYTDTLPTEVLLVMQYAQQVNSEGFQATHDTQIHGIIVGLYDGFVFLLTGHTMGAVDEDIVLNYGTMLLAYARPLYGSVQWEGE